MRSFFTTAFFVAVISIGLIVPGSIVHHHTSGGFDDSSPNVTFLGSVFAAEDDDGGGVTNEDDDDGGGVTNRPGTKGTTEIITLRNPLNVNSIEELLLLIVDVLLLLAVPIIVFFIIYSGFLFVTAQGNETQLTKAKSALLWTVVGGVILLGAKLILEVILATVKSIQL